MWQTLTIEQMCKLMDMGIDVSKASMCWVWQQQGEGGYHHLEMNRDLYPCDKDIPTFTLQDILNILSDIKEYVWVLNESGIILEDLRCNEFHREHHDNLIQAAFEMLVWCKQTNLI